MFNAACISSKGFRRGSFREGIPRPECKEFSLRGSEKFFTQGVKNLLKDFCKEFSKPGNFSKSMGFRGSAKLFIFHRFYKVLGIGGFWGHQNPSFSTGFIRFWGSGVSEIFKSHHFP